MSKIMLAINTLEKGGAERVLSNLANYLANENEVSIVMLEKREIEYNVSDDVKLFYAIDKQGKTNSKVLKVFKKIKDTIQQIKKIRLIVKQENPDIILSFLPGMSFRMLAANKTDIPVIVSVRNDPKIEYRTIGYKFFMKLLYPKAKGFIFQTDEASTYFSKKIVKDFEVISNPISEQFNVEPYKGNRKKVIVSVGRLTKQKNQEILIRAFSELSEKYNDYKLIIYGEGELRKNLESLIAEQNLKERVFLPGKKDNIIDYLYDAKMFVLSSDYEGMPNALMEAMAMGLPCISTDCPCGGPKFLIKNNENGLLVDVNDVKSLKDSIEKLINDEELGEKLSINANKIYEKLKPEKINKKYKDYIYKIGKIYEKNKSDL